MQKQFRGSMVALVTPFREDKSVDQDGLARLVDMQLDAGTDGLIICGTTGEAATMSLREQMETLSFVLKRVNGRIPVVAGTGSNDTRAAVEASLAAKEIGADALLVVTPPYNKPSQDGLLDYYRTIVKEAQHPIILYNVPGRTCSDLKPETVEQLADEPWIVAIKDATANMAVGSEIKRRCGDRVTLLSGDDFSALPLLSVGGEGWISVTGNVAPARMAQLFRAWNTGEVKVATRLHLELMELHKAMFMDSNPIPCKTVLSMMGLIEPHVRSPLVPMKAAAIETLAAVADKYNLRKGAH